jgi:hypothetical protein
VGHSQISAINFPEKVHVVRELKRKILHNETIPSAALFHQPLPNDWTYRPDLPTYFIMKSSTFV